MAARWRYGMNDRKRELDMAVTGIAGQIGQRQPSGIASRFA